MLSYQQGSPKLPKGLDAMWDAAVGLVVQHAPRARQFVRRAKRVLGLEESFASLNDAQVRKKGDELRIRFRLGRETPDDINKTFALVREVAFRQIGERPFLVQVAGGLALEAGCIAEMATGEGKTLTATMPALIAGWRGHGCHVITVNDFLARRDAEWMRPIYRFCGLEVAHIQQEMRPRERRQAYQADVTYCTNKEVAADFLRDRLAMGSRNNLPSVLLSRIGTGIDVAERVVHRGLACAIVDEADSVLIDEAVTPLIIAGEAPNAEQVEAYQVASQLASQMCAQDDYHVDRRYCGIALTAAGRAKLARLTSQLDGIWAGNRRREELVVQSLHAKEHFRIGKQYVIDNGNIVIVDESTGRLMPDRTWRDGLHQAIEAKEGLVVNPTKDTLARVSFQRFFRLYPKLSGMTGTATAVRRELWQVYHLRIAVIPTNQPCLRRQLSDRTFVSARAKWRSIVAEIHHVHNSGRPILVGTRNVRDSEHLSELLAAEGLEHRVLNAVRHAEEAEIVAGAGQEGKITVATNMAGRGTDIKLGPGVADRGGLHVIATERHGASRIDRQLYGRAGRQGDPGSAQAFVSLEDELLSCHAGHTSALLRWCFGQTDREITGLMTRQLFARAQHRAERVARQQRKAVLRSDDWLDDLLGFTGGEC